MPVERMTAKKVRISELMNGKWVKREGMEPSFIITDSGEKVSRARLLGTVVSRFLAEDGNFGSITLDDGTDTIRAKTFKTVKPVDDFSVGDLVDLIGKVREYNGEVYIIPEVITGVQDPNLEILRRLELIKKSREQKGKPSEASPEEQADAVKPGPAQEGDSGEKKEDDTELRKEVLGVIESDPEGVEYKTIMEKVNAPEARVESVLNEILAEGICYEPTPGRVKKI
jgi:RPA family protein